MLIQKCSDAIKRQMSSWWALMAESGRLLGYGLRRWVACLVALVGNLQLPAGVLDLPVVTVPNGRGPRPRAVPFALLDVAHFAVDESDLDVLVHVDSLRSDIGSFPGPSQDLFYFTGRHAE